MKTIEDLSKNEHLISELQKDEDDRIYRMVNGRKIYQAKEENDSDREFNRMVNLWRMRNI